MTDFETHPVGTGERLKRLEDCDGKRVRPTIAQVAAQVMRERGAERIWVGAFGMLDDIYDRARGTDDGALAHPLDRQAAVMAAVRRSPLFRRFGRIRSCYASARESWHPIFCLSTLRKDKAE